eukprot:Nk52_evm25s216 gene=Nk52_evmTU25s216
MSSEETKKQTVNDLPEKDVVRMGQVDLDRPSFDISFHNVTVYDDTWVEGAVGRLFPSSSSTSLSGAGGSDADKATSSISNVPEAPAGVARTVLLDDVTTVIKPGRMTLLVGPKGTGKTTFMELISANKNVVSKPHTVQGDILVNGKPLNETPGYYKYTGYSPLQEILYPTLTVRETLTYTAKLRLDPEEYTEERRTEVVNMVLERLGMEECADTLVGGGPIRGISGGQKRRLTIGCALVSLPRVLTLDEPTNGLDSANALSLIKYLKDVSQGGVPVVMTLQQPSFEIFNHFDDVILMAGRKLLYHGPVVTLESYINGLGFRTPDANENPADYYLDVTTFLQLQTDPVEDQRALNTKYGSLILKTDSGASKNTVAIEDAHRMWDKKSRDYLPSTIIDYKVKRKGHSDVKIDERRFYTSGTSQFNTLLHYTFIRMMRDPSNLQARLGRAIVMGIVIGTLFLQQDKDQTYVNSSMSIIFLWLAMGGMSNLGTISSLIDQREVFMFQTRSHYFRPVMSVMAGVVSGYPYQLMESIIIICISFFLVDLNSSADAFFITVLVYFINSALGDMYVRIASSIIRTKNLANSLAMTSLSCFLLANGYSIPKDSIPQGWRWFHYLSFFTYSQESVAIAIVRDVTLTCSADQLVPPTSDPDFSKPYPAGYQGSQVCPITTGEQILSFKGMETDNAWIWWDILIQLLFYVAFLVIFTAITVGRDVDEVVYTRKGAVKQRHELKKNVALFRRMSSSDVMSSTVNIPDSVNSAMKFMFDTFTFRDVVFDVDVEVEENVDGKTKKVKKTRRLLDNVNGSVTRGQMVALMGPSGAGKTTLLDALSGKINNGELSLAIDVNGEEINNELRKAIGYCEQTDKHIESATVREAFRFSADLRVDKSAEKGDKYRYVESIIDDLGMRPIADTYVRNLSAEQKKLVTIGVELAAQTSLVFLDEPTTGLDTTSAGNVIQVVRRLADKGLVVICTIHQPSQRVFNNFDGLCLLAKGKLVFFGLTGDESEKLFEYFATMGYEPLPKENPADYVLRVCQGKSEEEMQAIIDHYKASPEYHSLMESIESQKSVKDNSKSSKSGRSDTFASSTGKQLAALLKRNVLDRKRSFMLFWARILTLTFSGFFVGTMFFRLENNQAGASLRAGIGFFICLLASFDPITLVPDVIDARTVFYRERDAHTYGNVAFLASTLISEIPANFIKSVAFSVLAYYFAGIDDSGVDTFFLFLLNFFLVITLATSFWTLLSVTLPNSEVVSIVGPISNVVFVILFSGFVIKKDDIPDYWIWVYYISYLRYLVQNFSVKVFQGQTFYCDPDEYIPVAITDSNGNFTGQYKGYCQITSGEQMMEMMGVNASDFWPFIGYSLIFLVGFIGLALLAVKKIKF